MSKLRRAAGVVAATAGAAALATIAPVASSAPGVHSAATQGNCSRTAADQAILALGLEANPGDRNPAAQVLCGVPVFGPGVEAMVASVKIPSCGRTGDWLVWRHDGSSWRRVFESHNGADLVAVGAGIKETQFVLRPGDAHCFPTGGTRSRVWRWNGSRMASGPWVYSKPQASRRQNAAFWTPLPGMISCGMVASGRYAGVTCQSLNPHGRPAEAAQVVLKPNGRVRSCQGPSHRCPIGNPGQGTPRYRYGRTVTVGRFRCQVQRSGVRCMIVATGKGFLFNQNGTRRVG